VLLTFGAQSTERLAAQVQSQFPNQHPPDPNESQSNPSGQHRLAPKTFPHRFLSVDAVPKIRLAAESDHAVTMMIEKIVGEYFLAKREKL
jgi:RAB protein geranylgeranyltransferase component A